MRTGDYGGFQGTCSKTTTLTSIINSTSLFATCKRPWSFAMNNIQCFKICNQTSNPKLVLSCCIFVESVLPWKNMITCIQENFFKYFVSSLFNPFLFEWDLSKLCIYRKVWGRQARISFLCLLFFLNYKFQSVPVWNDAEESQLQWTWRASFYYS